MRQNIVEGKGWQTLETMGTMLLQGWTSLHNAIDSGSAQTARALLAHGADANLEFPECKDDSCEMQASFPTAFGHKSYSLAATASVAYHPSLCSSRFCNNNTSASLCAQFAHDIVAVSPSAAPQLQDLLAQEVHCTLFQYRAHCFTKVPRRVA